MKIALVAPVDEAVPPATYGGIEQLVHLLDRELTRCGHDIFLLASGGSTSLGRLMPVTDVPLSSDGRDRGPNALSALKEAAARNAASLLNELRPDVVLNHSWRLLDHAGSFLPILTTVHYPLDVDPYRSIFLERNHAAYVSVSWSQQRAARSLRFVGNVYNGVDLDSLTFSPQPLEYLAYLGRVHPDKGLDIAIRVAQRVGMPLKIAAKLDGSQRPWFDAVVRPLLRQGGAQLVGEVDAAGRARLLGGATALLHPSRWSEAFGLAIVEAMACGTPVVALRRGAIPELVEDGTTGFVVDDEERLAGAVIQAGELDRAACRAHAEARFGYERMAADYEKLARNVTA